MKLEDYIKKFNNANNFGNLGLVNAAVKAATMFEEPAYVKLLKSFNSTHGFLKNYNEQQSILKSLSGISNTLMQTQKMTSLSELTKSVSIAEMFYKPDHFSFLTNSLKGGLSDVYSKVNTLGNFLKPIAIPEMYKTNISKIISNNNSIFEDINSLTKILSANNVVQAQVLSQYSAATLNASLAESIRTQNWEDIETIEELTEEITT
jgi:hypothetical protein